MYYWNKYFIKLQHQGFDMMSVILFLHDLKPWLTQIEGLEQLYEDMNKIFENSVDASLFEIFFKPADTTFKLNLQVAKVRTAENQSALERFNNLLSDSENEELLFIDFNSRGATSRFLDKFYLIEISESRGIVLHEKVDFEVLEEAGIRKLCIVPRDLNDRGVVCTLGSKLAVINNRKFSEIAPISTFEVDDENLSAQIVQSITRLSAFKLSQNKLCTINEQSRLLAILEICSKWNLVSSIRNLPGHIYGTMELVNQIKNKYMNNSKADLKYFCSRYRIFSDNQAYQEFCLNNDVLTRLVKFSKAADEELSKFYGYQILPEELFASLLSIATNTISDCESLRQLQEQCEYLSHQTYTPKYSNPEMQLMIRSLINMTHVFHDLTLLSVFSTLADVENIFVLPYKIDKQKYEFEEKLKDVLAQTLYHYQLTLNYGAEVDNATLLIIDELKAVEVDLKANIAKMPNDYENQRSKVKQLLLKLKEVFSDNIDNLGLSKLAAKIYESLRGVESEEPLNYDEAHHKLRSVTSLCTHLYRAFYKEFGYLIGPFVLTLLNIVNDLSISLVACERLSHGSTSVKVHRKILNYPELYENPLSMLEYSNSRAQIDSIFESMHYQVQELVRLEVGAKREKDLETQEKEELKGIFKIKITPQIEHLMKISKSIFDKTKADKAREEELEREEIAQNFPTYHEEFDRDRIFDREEVQNVDYEDPIEEPNFMTFNSFRNLNEKKKCFYKLLKTYKALLQKRNSILNQNDHIKTVSDSAILIEKFQELSTLLKQMFSRQAVEKLEESLTNTETKMLNLKIKKCFEALIEESKMSDTKITLQVSSKDFPENYNFYEDPYFTEIKLVYAPMIKIIHRCLVLLEDWGDHPILVDAITYCNKILSFHCYQTPLQKVLTGLELVLQKLNEYSKIACKLNSVQDQINTCKLLIIRYRKIQIVSWRHMMHSKLEHALVDDYDNFIHLTYALNTEVIKESDIEYDKIFDAVDLYIRDSNLSQFNNRLLHLNILRDQMDTIQKKGVSNVLHFVYMYYSYLQEKHRSVMLALQNETETKIRTIVDVSKWSVQKFETSTVGKAYKQLNKAMNGYTRNVLDQNITNSVLSKSREEIVTQFKNCANGVRNEFTDIGREPESLIKKDVHAMLSNNDLIKRLRHVVKHQVFSKWLDVNFIEQKNGQIINKILDEWDKKQSSQRRDLNELFKFLKYQDVSANYKRVIEANRTSKFISYDSVRFLYSHPSINISDSMKYILTRNEFYFYKNFEKLLILSSSYQSNQDIRNHEISAMRNLTGSLYYKLLSYSKHLNSIIDCMKENSTSNENCRFKHSILLEQLKAEAKGTKNIESYETLNFSETKRIIFSFTKTLERINCMISVNVLKELDYYQQIRCCTLTKEKAIGIIEHIEDIKTRISSRYDTLCNQFDEDVVVDLLNELNSVSTQLQKCIEESKNTQNDKVIELYKKRIMLLYQSFAKFEPANANSTVHSKDEDKEKEPGMDEHIDKLKKIFEVLNEALPSIKKLESKASESGLVEVSVIAFDTHIFLLRVIERCIRYQKSLCKLLYILLSLFIHLTYNGFCGEKDQEEEEGEGEADEKDNFEMQDGTGMGEGKGMQNVSDQIEHEEQLEGLKDEQGDPDQEMDQQKKEDKAFDMKNDFAGKNEEMQKDEDKQEDEDEVNSQDLDDEMDDVDNKLDNELFNEDNEISSESDNDDRPQEDTKKPPVDLDKQVDLEHKDNEAKGHDEKDDRPEADREKPENQKEPEIPPEAEQDHDNDVNEQKEDQEQPFVNIDEQIKEEKDEPEPEQDQDQGEDKEDGDMEQEQEEEKDEEMSVEGEHKFDPTKEDEKGKEDEQQNQDDNDFDIEDLENMDGDDGANEQEHQGDEVESEQLDDDENPDEEPDVDAERDQQPDEDDKALASQVQIDKKQENNALGNNQEKGEKQEEQTKQENQQNTEEQKDYNTEDNDYLFQLMQQYMHNKNKEEKKKPQEGERNEDQNMKKADNVEEIEDLPDQPENNDDQEIDGQDFAVDEKSKELRSNVADTVKYNDEDMEQKEDEEQQPEDQMAPDQKEEEEMDVDEPEKNLDEVKDNDPIKSMIKTNEFYQKYLEDKAKKEEEVKKEQEEKEAAEDPKDQREQYNDAPMEQEEEEEEKEFQLTKEEYKLDDTHFDVLDLKKSMIERYEKWRKDKDLVSNSYELLNKFKKTTHHLSISLCEQMRMILEPTEKSRLKGDYKTGKRINIKKIIPFIASNYRNDKIWLRREMPFKRDYRIMIAIDDSLSMKKNNLGFFALESLVAISEALNQLSVGKVCVSGINDRMDMHMSFEDTYSAEKAAFILSNYSFDYQSFASADTSIPNFMADCNKLLDSLKTENRNIVFIISDGRFNKKKALPYIMEAEDKKYLYVFILLDNYGIESKNSIFNMKSAELVVDENGKSDYKITRYLDDFPFKYYTVVQEISHLPKVLSNIFLQWLAMVNS